MRILNEKKLLNFNSSKLNEIIIGTNLQSIFLNFFLLKFLKISSKKPIFFIFEDGFMSRHTKCIRSLNLMNIATVEYQHGAIYAGHEAYNTKDQLITQVKKHKMLPQIFWSFGDGWKNYANLITDNSVVGVPWYKNVKPIKMIQDAAQEY